MTLAQKGAAGIIFDISLKKTLFISPKFHDFSLSPASAHIAEITSALEVFITHHFEGDINDVIFQD
jgi:hypothetical protein